MHHWQQKQRQRVHHNMIEQARPTIKRYSRQKGTLTSSRTKYHTGSSNNINMPFKQVLNIFKLQHYEDLLVEHGFPQKIKERDSISLIDQMMKRVTPPDHDKFLSLMSALLSISSDTKNLVKRTPIIKRSNQKHYPPSHNSTNFRKCDSITLKKKDKMPHFRIKSRQNIARQSETPSKLTEKSTVRKRSKAKDDTLIVHEFKPKGGCHVRFANKSGLLERLETRLKGIKGLNKQSQFGDAHLHYKQIKEMYLSYDTATLTSNISNIDIEEVISCFAIEIQKKIVQLPNKSIRQPPLNPELKRVKSKKHKIQQLLKESLVESNRPSYVVEPDYLGEELASQIDEAESIGSSDDNLDTEMEQSQTLFDMQNHHSIAYDLSCFDYQYEDEIKGACSRGDIKNFVQLVMMAGKMEKQTPILAHVYIRRVLASCRQDKLSSRNWKNIVLITLIEASKIWDDQSLENHSFSKVIRPYTTLEINRLQRHLLGLLNYTLTVNPKEYCESYFTLRRNSGQAAKTAHLMPLDLATIKRLQAPTAKKCERTLKQTYKKKLNQSF